MQKINKVTGLVLGVAAGAFILGSTGGAVAGSLITSHNIENNTIRSIDLKDGKGVGIADLKPGLAALVQKHAQDGTNGTNGTNGADGAPGKDGSVAGIQTNWVANEGAHIIDASTVTVSNPGTSAGSSVEILDLNLPAQATKKVQFTYSLADGAVYAAGSPRVFVQIGNDYYNTFDADPSDAGVDNGDGTFTKTWTIPANGTVHNAGIVSDSGLGTVTVTNLKISGFKVNFS